MFSFLKTFKNTKTQEETKSSAGKVGNIAALVAKRMNLAADVRKEVSKSLDKVI